MRLTRSFDWETLNMARQCCWRKSFFETNSHCCPKSGFFPTRLQWVHIDEKLQTHCLHRSRKRTHDVHRVSFKTNTKWTAFPRNEFETIIAFTNRNRKPRMSCFSGSKCSLRYDTQRNWLLTQKRLKKGKLWTKLSFKFEIEFESFKLKHSNGLPD